MTDARLRYRAYFGCHGQLGSYSVGFLRGTAMPAFYHGRMKNPAGLAGCGHVWTVGEWRV